MFTIYHFCYRLSMVKADELYDITVVGSGIAVAPDKSTTVDGRALTGRVSRPMMTMDM